MANNTQRKTLTHTDWIRLSAGNATVKLQVLSSDVLVYMTDSDSAPDDTANKDSYVLKPTNGYEVLSTALKIYVKKHNIDNVLCDIIYLTE